MIIADIKIINASSPPRMEKVRPIKKPHTVKK
jgi:hypothetical protein